MTPTNMPEISAIVAATEQIASKSDRWLFVFLLVIVIVAAFLMVKWAIGQISKQNEQHRQDTADRDKRYEQLHSERLAAAEARVAEVREINREASEAQREIIRAYSQALADNARVMGSVESALKDLQREWMKARAGA